MPYPVVAVTGGIASGKSTVCARFANHGVDVVDTDAIARELVTPGSTALAEIRDAFGAHCLSPTGELNRQHLRARIFADPVAKDRLERILHPRIRAQVHRQIASARSDYAIVAIPLLAESADDGYRFDRVLVVDTEPRLQLERVIRRDGESPASAQRILAAQASRAARLALADDVIINTGSLTDLAAQTDRLHQCYLRLAHQHG